MFIDEVVIKVKGGRGGEIAGAMISKAVYTIGGIILAALGLNRINK